MLFRRAPRGGWNIGASSPSVWVTSSWEVAAFVPSTRRQSLVVTAEQVDEALDIWGKVLAEV